MDIKMKMLYQCICVLIVLFSEPVLTLWCNHCDRADDISQCQQKKLCQNFPGDQHSTEICQNDFRVVNNKVELRKMCKARQSCLNEIKQPDNNCNEHNGKDVVCRCCCSTNYCNRKKKGCVLPSDCKKPRKPINGVVICPNPDQIKLKDTCRFKCNKGFRLEGPPSTTCSKELKTGTLTWIPANLPLCIKKLERCKPPHKDPVNGKVTCVNPAELSELTDFNYVGSICNFECDPHYTLKGKPKSTCQKNGQWSSKAPTCKRNKCPAFKLDINRIDECTEGNWVGSKCSFECKKGYRRTGVETIDCEGVEGKKFGKWSDDPPACVKIICRPKYTTVVNGRVSCTDENFENSVCTFTCNKGYDLTRSTQDTYSIKCESFSRTSTQAEWSGPPDTCSKIKCLPILTDPDNGNVECTDSNNEGSICTYTCRKGYDLDGTRSTEWKTKCENDGDGDSVGEWSERPGTCSRLKCPTKHVDPINGEVVCTDENFIGSICRFRCDENYDLDQSSLSIWRSTCVDDGDGDLFGEWDQPAATCTQIICVPPHTNPENGIVECTARNLLTSICNFRCKDGYNLFGKRTSTCLDLKKDGDEFGEWTSKAPTCEIGVCSDQEYDRLTVTRDCGEADDIGSKVVGTVCKYTCRREGYYMTTGDNKKELIKEGELVAECQKDESWSAGPPICRPVTCVPPLEAPDNGFPPSCSNGNIFQSQCTFRCKENYGVSHNRTIECLNDGDNDEFGEWSDKPPTCERINCDEFGEVKFGVLKCSDGRNIGSQCDLICNDRYTLRKFEYTTCTANRPPKGDPDWHRRRLFCCVKCIFNPAVKLVVVVDKTAVSTESDWLSIVDFVQYTLYDLRSNGFDINFGLVAYDTEVDVASEMKLKRLEKFEYIDDIIWDMEEIKYGGKESFTAKALARANEEMFTPVNQHEEPYLILITGGESADNVESLSKTIRDKDINILAAAINSGGRKPATEEYLTGITGDEKNIMILESSDLSDFRKVQERITKISQEKGCSSASKAQSCP